MGNKSLGSRKGNDYHEIQNHQQCEFSDGTIADEVKESLTEEHECTHNVKSAFVEGNRLFKEGRFDLAKAEYAKALRILRELHNHDEMHTAAALSNIGILEFMDGRYAQAETLLTEALAIRHNWQLNSSVPGLQSLETLSMSLSKDSMFCKVPEEQILLAKELKEHGKIDGVIADTINNLGACLELLGRIEDAKAMYENSLKMRKIVYGEKSVKVAESMLNLATILDSRGHLIEAEELLRKALQIYKEKVGAESPESSVAMNNLGVLVCHLGRLDEAQKLLESVYLIRQLCFGEENQQTVSAKLNLEYIMNKRKGIGSRALEAQSVIEK